jgi:hypothetical protein
MELAISFTATFIDFCQGKVTLAELEDCKLAFGCHRDHLIREDDLLPQELSWVNPNQTKHHYGKDVDLIDVDDETLSKWSEFLIFVKGKDARGEVFWQCGNYPVLRDDALYRGIKVYYQNWHYPKQLNLSNYREDRQFTPSECVEQAKRVLDTLFGEQT